MTTPGPMPELGESVTEGTVTRWLKQPGKRVERVEPLLEVATDKVLARIIGGEDKTAAITTKLAVLDQSDDASAAFSSDGPPEPDHDKPSAAPAPAAPTSTAAAGSDGESEWRQLTPAVAATKVGAVSAASGNGQGQKPSTAPPAQPTPAPAPVTAADAPTQPNRDCRTAACSQHATAPALRCLPHDVDERPPPNAVPTVEGVIDG